MTTTTTTIANPEIDVHACASNVMAALADLQGYLNSSINPDRIALADLEMGPMGWTKLVYTPKAFEIWSKQHQLFDSDPLILHHLAIMHHARAFDLEAGPNPSQSDADWAAAMGYWHRLHGMDVFWDRLTEKACAGTARQDAIDKLRAAFPQMILAVHYDIALDEETRQKRKSRAKFHISMVHKSPFDAGQRAEAQRAAYNRYIKCVPDEVWQKNELREEVLSKGQKAIVEYLDFDPGCLPALEDALRLQRRIQRSRNTAWQAMGEGDPKRKALLLLEKKDAEAWRVFFDQLAAVADQLEESVREDLARWYHGRGGDLCALDEREKGIEFYERAVSLCRPEDEERKVHVRQLVQTLAYVAREKAVKEDADAKSYCDKVRQRSDLSMVASLFLAQAYVRLSAFDAAEDLCGKGMSIEPDFDDLEADQWLGRLKEFQRDIPILKLMPAAKDAMESGRYQDAVRSLDAAEKLAKAADNLGMHNSIYWLRVQAHLALDHLADAKRDLILYQGLLDKDSSPSDIQAGQKLAKMVAEKEEMGNIRPLLDKAQEAMRANRFNDALPPLNEAARKAPNMDVVFFLRAQALAATGKIAEARQDIQKVASLAKSDEDRKHVENLKEMVVQAETANVVRELLGKAKQCMETGRFKEAVAPLDEAARKAPRTDSIFFLRAQAHMALGHVAEAKRDTETVISLAETPDDISAAARLEEMIKQAEATLAIKGLLDKAKQSMEAGRFEQALPPLDEAARKAPGVDSVFFLRAQAHMALGHVDEARRDAKTVTALAKTPDDVKAAAKLEEMIKQGQSTAAINRLLTKAQSAMEGSRFSEAAQALDEAAQIAPEVSAIYFLRAQARAGARNLMGAIQDSQKFEQLASTREEREAAQRLKRALLGS
ncbi:MAG: tetratricopeptide repeat protein [Terracidiphilus sp.]